MKRDLLRRNTLLLLLVLIFSAPAFAGNPLYVNPDTSPLTWDTSSPIRYRVDSQGFGALTQEQSKALVQAALQVWQNVPDTSLQFEYIGSTQEALTLDNWENLIGHTIYALGERTSSSEISAAQDEGILVFGFDNTGEILVQIGSENAAGIHSLTGVSGNYAEPDSITSAFVLLNGTYYDGADDVFSDLELNDIFAILIHEIGHALGLEHSLANTALYEEILNGTRPLSDARYLPTMFPRFIRGTGETIASLNPDDIVTLQQLYGTQVTLDGEVTNSERTPAAALVVTARDTSSSLCRAYSQVTSIWCGIRNSLPDGSGTQLFNAPYCLDENTQGAFRIAVDTTSAYVLSVEDIPELFETAITRLLGHVDHNMSEAEFFNTDDVAAENLYGFNAVDVEIDSVEDLGITLAETASTNPAVTTFPIGTFEDGIIFFQDDDELCPSYSVVDISAQLADISPLPNFSSSGCSLTCSAATPSHSFVLWVLLASGLLATRLRYALYGLSKNASFVIARSVSDEAIQSKYLI